MTENRKLRSFKILGIVVILALTLMSCRLTSPIGDLLPYNNNEADDSEVQVLPSTNTTQTSVQVPQSVEDEQAVLINLYQRINPSVVNITTYTNQDGQLFGLSQGSGFLYDDQGHIVTNAHVVEGAADLDVIFADSTIVIGKVVATDPNSDLAVIKIDQVPANVQPLVIGDSDALSVGQTVVAIGNPFGLDGTLTRGIVSALGRNIPALTDFSIPQAIQTDAPINPGNSGGPLLNLLGEVIGVNAQIETGGTGRANTGVGFAIPANIVKRVVPDLIEKGEHEWAWLGVRGGTLAVAQSQAMNLPVQNGAYISEIVPGGPAEGANMRGSSGTSTVDGREYEVGGDVITAIDGRTVASFDDILIYIALETHPGQSVQLEILRNGKPMSLSVTLEKRPTSLQ